MQYDCFNIYLICSCYFKSIIIKNRNDNITFMILTYLNVFLYFFSKTIDFLLESNIYLV